MFLARINIQPQTYTKYTHTHRTTRTHEGINKQNTRWRKVATPMSFGLCGGNRTSPTHSGLTIYINARDSLVCWRSARKTQVLSEHAYIFVASSRSKVDAFIRRRNWWRVFRINERPFMSAAFLTLTIVWQTLCAEAARSTNEGVEAAVLCYCNKSRAPKTRPRIIS